MEGAARAQGRQCQFGRRKASAQPTRFRRPFRCRPATATAPRRGCLSQAACFAGGDDDAVAGASAGVRLSATSPGTVSAVEWALLRSMAVWRAETGPRSAWFSRLASSGRVKAPHSSIRRASRIAGGGRNLSTPRRLWRAVGPDQLDIHRNNIVFLRSNAKLCYIVSWYPRRRVSAGSTKWNARSRCRCMPRWNPCQRGFLVGDGARCAGGGVGSA